MDSYTALLGKRVRDILTDYKGVVTCVAFDLFGSVQCIVDAGYDDKGNRLSNWFDHKRLLVTDSDPVMAPPRW